MRASSVAAVLLATVGCGHAARDPDAAAESDTQVGAQPPLSSDCTGVMPDVSGPQFTVTVPGQYCSIGETTAGNGTLTFVTADASGRRGPIYLYRAWDGAPLGSVELDPAASNLFASDQFFVALQTDASRSYWEVRSYDHDGQEIARVRLVGARSSYPDIAAAPDGGAFLVTHEFDSSGAALIFYRFDAQGHVVSGPVEIDREPFGPIGAPQASVWPSPAGDVLVGFSSTTSADVMGLWVDRDGRVLTRRLPLVVNPNGFAFWPSKLPAVAGGVLPWLSSAPGFVPELATRLAEIPEFLKDRPWIPPWAFASLPRQRAYVVATTTPFYEVVAPAGNTCGTFRTAAAGKFAVGRDGSFIVKSDGCTFTWWPRAFR